ncbi:MAG: hypothetical protein INR71_03025, partial [Terriglobus roseus]|nr:hypothetical protein [Terriglobus roseus]
MLDSAAPAPHQRDSASKLSSLMNGFLFTPPENLADSFSKAGSTSPEWQHKLPILHHKAAAPSPPITPESKSLPSFDCSNSYTTADAPLFPNRASSETLHADAPLFGAESRRSLSPSSDLGSAHDIAASSPSRLGHVGRVAGTALPIEYSPAGASAYYHARMDELNRYRAMLPKPTASPATERDVYSKRQLQSLGKPVGVAKTRPAPRTTPKLKAA